MWWKKISPITKNSQKCPRIWFLGVTDEAYEICHDLLHYFFTHIYCNPDNLFLVSSDFPLLSWVKLHCFKCCLYSTNSIMRLWIPLHKVSLRYSLEHLGENCGYLSISVILMPVERWFSAAFPFITGHGKHAGNVGKTGPKSKLQMTS